MKVYSSTRLSQFQWLRTCVVGFAAGSWYNNGGGVDHQCLPLTPQYSRYNTDTYNSVIYGVEYQTHTDGDGKQWCCGVVVMVLWWWCCDDGVVVIVLWWWCSGIVVFVVMVTVSCGVVTKFCHNPNSNNLKRILPPFYLDRVQYSGPQETNQHKQDVFGWICINSYPNVFLRHWGGCVAVTLCVVDRWGLTTHCWWW